MPELMIDAHVHLHPGDDPWDRLMQAHERMMAAAGGKDCLAVFMLAEQQGCDAFGTLKASARTTAEPESLWLETGSADLLVLAGRQVVSAERLEMLALATAADFADGAPAEQLIEAMDAADALIILPWGSANGPVREGGWSTGCWPEIRRSDCCWATMAGVLLSGRSVASAIGRCCADRTPCR